LPALTDEERRSMTDGFAALFALVVFPGFGFVFVCALAFQWIDRRVTARLQGRIGPPWFQPLADFVKLMTKEDLLPTGASERICAILPLVSLASVLTASLYIPVAGKAASGFEGDLIVVLFLLTVPALAYFVAGWVSVGVYSIIGGSRSLLQYFSYEVPFLMALSGPAILSGSWSISLIATQQQSQGVWAVFVQPLGFLLAVVGLMGKLKRTPFDIPKAKSEVLAGPLTEFSGRKLALWHLGLDMKTVVGIFLLTNAFLGGSGSGTGALSVFSFALKALLILLILSVTSVLYARMRIDQLADLGWRVLAPLALLQTMVTIWIGTE
jgi:NADH-quinone oxidoreductase subunit H